MSSLPPGAEPHSEFDAHAALRSGRGDLADYLEQLDLRDWSRPSLCDGWTITDVVAHLTLSTTETWRHFIIGMVRNLGNFDRWNATSARHHAQHHTLAELVALLREHADSRHHSPGSSHLDQLLDLLVHSQDISTAIDSPYAVPLGPAVAALDHALASRWYGAKKRFTNIHLSATDANWTFGDGPEIRGPVTALLLLSTGRAVALADVAGDGVATVRSRMRLT